MMFLGKVKTSVSCFLYPLGGALGERSKSDLCQNLDQMPLEFHENHWMFVTVSVGGATFTHSYRSYRYISDHLCEF